MNRKTILLLAVPFVGGLLVFGAVALRNGTSVGSGPSRKSSAMRVEGSLSPAAPRPPLPKPAPEKTIARAMDEARLKTTYQNYRTALATGNRIQADALYPVLMKERKAALQMAQQDLAQARQEFDRSVAEKAVDALRR
jgi:hypothetical protein